MENIENLKKDIQKRVIMDLGKEFPQAPISKLTTPLQLFLNALIDNLQLSTSASPHVTVADKEMSPLYKFEGTAPLGFSLPQLLKEFSIIKKDVIQELQHQGQLSYEIRNKIDEVFEVLGISTAESFISTKQKNTEEALNKAEVSNRDLEQFAGVAAHDLKSPLATISGYVSLLNEELGQLANSPGHEYIPIIESAAERMRHLIDHLLEHARLAAQNHQFIDVDLNEVLKITEQNLHESIETTHTQIKSQKMPIVQGDPALLVQLFQNLFANSIKFRSSKPPVIEVNVDDKKFAQYLLFSVKDNGIGFDPKEKENIFGLYTTLHSKQEYSGSGIGLATCKKVVELHDGRIWAESVPNKGTTIWFTLAR
ncbi:sensor histidine kinase [uncultured Bdellovibrio sp.]|uniref:sensor histidine kinase n=1 Tax=Bdellovibrio sp. HCB-162 TaxID=3394234 RepID=UPI0025F69828|nr:ATP-binding protein [uncultured Bdellovibrio sp.]